MMRRAVLLGYDVVVRSASSATAAATHGASLSTSDFRAARAMHVAVRPDSLTSWIPFLLPFFFLLESDDDDPKL